MKSIKGILGEGKIDIININFRFSTYKIEHIEKISETLNMKWLVLYLE